MKCPACSVEGTVLAVLTFELRTPLLKGGGVQPPAVTVRQMKEVWKEAPEGSKKIECSACHAEFRYYRDQGLVQVVSPPPTFLALEEGGG